MTVRDLIDAEINKLGEETLDELYEVVKQFAQEKSAVHSNHHKSGTLSKLKQIKIQAPADFATNIDSYLNGEQQIASDPNLR